MTKKNPNDTGLAAENAAAAFLEQEGYTILERRFRCRGGEVDLIGVKGTDLVFVEVRYRVSEGHGTPLETVGPTKQQRLSRAIGLYLAQNAWRFADYSYRCDVVAVTGSLETPVIAHYENVFVPFFA